MLASECSVLLLFRHILNVFFSPERHSKHSGINTAMRFKTPRVQAVYSILLLRMERYYKLT